jgi:hypothetical protein
VNTISASVLPLRCRKHKDVLRHALFRNKIDKMAEEEDIIIEVFKKSCKLITQNIIKESV